VCIEEFCILSRNMRDCARFGVLFDSKGENMTQRLTATEKVVILLAFIFLMVWPHQGWSADTPLPAGQPGAQLPPAIPSPAVKDPNVLTLDEAVAIALDNHPSLKAARERIGAQQAVLGQQMSAYYPTINFANQYRTSETGEAAGPTRAADTFLSEARINMTLYNFGKREGTVEAARETLYATAHNYRSAVDAVIVGAKQSYYGYLQARAIVTVREETVRNRELLVRQAQGFYQVGTRARIDVVRAESNLYNAQADLIAAQNGLQVAWATFKNALGLRELPERPLAEEAIVTTVPFVTLEQARESAFANRPELKSFQSQRRAQDQLIATARRGHLPDIIFDAAYGRRHDSDERENSTNRRFDTFPLQPAWSVGLSLTIPIFDGFRTTNRVEESLRNYHVIRAQEEQQRQQVALEVEQGYLRLVEVGERIKANEAAARAAKENLDLAQGRYQVGVGSIIEVTDAQTLYTDAQTTYVRALYDYRIADAQLRRAIGQ
jgi:outer membrane protein